MLVSDFYVVDITYLFGSSQYFLMNGTDLSNII